MIQTGGVLFDPFLHVCVLHLCITGIPWYLMAVKTPYATILVVVPYGGDIDGELLHGCMLLTVDSITTVRHSQTQGQDSKC